MINLPYLSYEQLYQLFGYKTPLDLEKIFDMLLFSISVVDTKTVGYSPMRTIDNGTNLLPEVYVYLYPQLKASKAELPKYLGKPYAYKEMLRIDARMRLLQMKKLETKQISWYKFWKKIKAYQEICNLSEPQVDIQLAFQLLEYRAKQEGISKKELHTQFRQYAETYPIEKM